MRALTALTTMVLCAAPAGAGAQGAPGPTGGLPPPGTYTLDPPHTFVYFDARHKLVGLASTRRREPSW